MICGKYYLLNECMNDKLKRAVLLLFTSLVLVIIEQGGAIGVIRTNLASPHASSSSLSASLSLPLSFPHPFSPFPQQNSKRCRCWLQYQWALAFQLGRAECEGAQSANGEPARKYSIHVMLTAADIRLENEYMCLGGGPVVPEQFPQQKKSLCHLHWCAKL